MAYWSKKCKWAVNYKGFCYHYDTAYELGQMVAESNSNMQNPYDPQNTDYDDFNNGRYDYKHNNDPDFSIEPPKLE